MSKFDVLICQWNHCQRNFNNLEALNIHLEVDHCVPSCSNCQWTGCTLSAVHIPSMMIHLQQEHCNLKPCIPQPQDDSQLSTSSSSSSPTHSILNTQNQSKPTNTLKQEYAILKAKYRYIKRENQILQDEYNEAKKKIRRHQLMKNLLIDEIQSKLYQDDPC